MTRRIHHPVRKPENAREMGSSPTLRAPISQHINQTLAGVSSDGDSAVCPLVAGVATGGEGAGRSFPGIAQDRRAAINLEARAELAAALARGLSPGRLVLHITDECARVELRTGLVEHFQANGMKRLARKIQCANVPAGALLTLVVADETKLLLVPIAMLIPQVPAAPARTNAP